jgi:hypothetical protein
MESDTGMAIENTIIRKELIYLCFINILTNCLLNMNRRAIPKIITSVPNILFVSCMVSILLLEFPDLKAV